jgi:hypothetical protein
MPPAGATCQDQHQDDDRAETVHQTSPLTAPLAALDAASFHRNIMAQEPRETGPKRSPPARHGADRA